MKLAVLALQGAFRAHVERLRALGVDDLEVVEARLPRDLAGVDGLVMPGGESTTMSNLLLSSGLFDELSARLDGGWPVFGTCAGMILLAREVRDGRPDQRSFGALDITVRRNGYGRQLDSFETDLDLDGLDDVAASVPFHGVFIRAPRIEAAGSDVEVLATHDGDPVLVRQGAVMAASFHPELTLDGRLHAAFVDLVRTVTSTTPSKEHRDVRSLQVGHDQAQEGCRRQGAREALQQARPAAGGGSSRRWG